MPRSSSSHACGRTRQLDEVSTLLALAAAQRGVNKGDRIALVSVNTDLSVIVFLAATKVGALFVPLNPAATDDDLQYMLEHSGASVVVCQPEDLERTRAIVERIDSGPTRVIDLNELGLASPNVATLTASIRRLAANTQDVELPEIGPDDPRHRHLHLRHHRVPEGSRAQPAQLRARGRSVRRAPALAAYGPLAHAAAVLSHQCAVLFARRRTGLRAARSITARSFSASRFWNLAAETRATQFNFLAAVGAILMKRARSEFNPAHRLRKMYGAPISEEMLRVFNDEFHVPWLIEGYGMTEIPGAACNPFLGPHKLGSIGVPAVHPRFPGNFSALRVVDDAGNDVPNGEIGELVVKTPIVFKEYLERSRADRSRFPRRLVPHRRSRAAGRRTATSISSRARRTSSAAAARTFPARSWIAWSRAIPTCSKPPPSACPPSWARRKS